MDNDLIGYHDIGWYAGYHRTEIANDLRLRGFVADPGEIADSLFGTNASEAELNASICGVLGDAS